MELISVNYPLYKQCIRLQEVEQKKHSHSATPFSKSKKALSKTVPFARDGLISFPTLDGDFC